MIAALMKLAGGYVGYAALAVSLAGGAAWMLHTHDQRVLAEAQTAIDAATSTELARQHAATLAALEQSAAEAQARAATFEQIKAAIHAQPITKVCAASPAVRAVIDGLRQSAGGPHATSADPGQPANLSH